MLSDKGYSEDIFLLCICVGHSLLQLVTTTYGVFPLFGMLSPKCSHNDVWPTDTGSGGSVCRVSPLIKGINDPRQCMDNILEPFLIYEGVSSPVWCSPAVWLFECWGVVSDSRGLCAFTSLPSEWVTRYEQMLAGTLRAVTQVVSLRGAGCTHPHTHGERRNRVWGWGVWRVLLELAAGEIIDFSPDEVLWPASACQQDCRNQICSSKWLAEFWLVQD